jgi:hypothetical protein
VDLALVDVEDLEEVVDSQEVVAVALPQEEEEVREVDSQEVVVRKGDIRRMCFCKLSGVQGHFHDTFAVREATQDFFNKRIYKRTTPFFPYQIFSFD